MFKETRKITVDKPTLWKARGVILPKEQWIENAKKQGLPDDCLVAYEEQFTPVSVTSDEGKEWCVEQYGTEAYETMVLKDELFNLLYNNPPQELFKSSIVNFESLLDFQDMVKTVLHASQLAENVFASPDVDFNELVPRNVMEENAFSQLIDDALENCSHSPAEEREIARFIAQQFATQQGAELLSIAQQCIEEARPQFYGLDPKKAVAIVVCDSKNEAKKIGKMGYCTTPALKSRDRVRGRNTFNYSGTLAKLKKQFPTTPLLVATSRKGYITLGKLADAIVITPTPAPHESEINTWEDALTKSVIGEHSFDVQLNSAVETAVELQKREQPARQRQEQEQAKTSTRSKARTLSIRENE